MARRTPSSTRGGAPRDRQVERTLIAVRLGATAFGVLAGVACYVVLDQFTAIGMIPAFVLGLGFALLARIATASLARDWLIHAAERQRAAPTQKRTPGRN